MKEDKLVPKRRFKEFENNDVWEQRKLGDLSEFITKGATPTTYGFDWVDDGIPFFRNDSIKNNRFTYGAYSYISEEANNTLIRSEIRKNDILIAITGDIGKVGIVPGNVDKANINQHMAKVRIKKDAYPYFVYQFLSTSSIQLKYKKIKTGISMPQLSLEQIREIDVLLPSMDEQIKMGNYFQEMDNLITLHQRKLKKLKEIKLAYLSEMFPKEGEKYPKRRFAGFTEAWEQCKLGELTNVYDGTHQTPTYTDNGIMFLSVENIKTLQSEKYISEEDFKKDFKIFPEKGDILMTRIGDIGTANVIESNQPIAYYVSLALLKYKELDPYFLKESIGSETVKNELWHRTLHIAFPKKINKNEIGNITIQYPKSKEEQVKIGEFFKELDNLIALHQHKLEKLENLKKAYLNEIFV